MLFDVKQIEADIELKANKTKSGAVRTKGPSLAVLSKQADDLKKIIGDVKMGQNIHFASIREWSAHGLLAHLLKQTGPAALYFSTWSISEDSLRSLVNKKNAGEIQKISAVFDWNVKNQRPEAYQYAKKNIPDLILSTCHAKSTVIQNKTWSIAIIGSANYTANPRIETGVITCEKIVADFHKDWILKELTGENPFNVKMNDKIKQKTN